MIREEVEEERGDQVSVDGDQLLVGGVKKPLEGSYLKLLSFDFV
jgi:hypothetical protein